MAAKAWAVVLGGVPAVLEPRLRRPRVHLIPNHHREQELLQATGHQSIDELFAMIPSDLQISGLDLPDGEPERHLVSRLRRIMGRNQGYHNMSVFLGGGLKPQLVPSAVQAVIHRQELKNAYTPYQPEVSQGLLQSLFEYQSLMCDLTRMDVVNSSMYDQATALGEAALMSVRVSPKRKKFLIPEALSLPRRSVVQNYAKGPDLEIVSYKFDQETGQADIEDIASKLDEAVCGIYLENPSFLGVFEEQAEAIGQMAHDAGALFVLGVDPTTLGVAKPPGLLGADIVIGDASCFGGAPALGGPLLGLFGCREKLVRKMPGRLIGATHDETGKRGYVMTLQAREQHIRRAKATSNICSNEALIANQAAMHLSMLGRSGLRTMGLQNLAAGKQLLETLSDAGLNPRFTGTIYNEVVTEVDNPKMVHEKLLESGVHGGLRLSRHIASLDKCMLWGATPIHADHDFQALRQGLLAGGGT